MMGILQCIFLSVVLMIADGFIVNGPSEPLIVELGASVVLPCSVDKPLLIEGLEVEWKRTDSETLVHLFEDGESRPEAQQQDYHDRAHFFTEEIQHGNFSLLLNNVRAEDKGVYRCIVYSDQDSNETVVKIKDLERLIVSGPDPSVSAYEGEDVTLSCSVDSHIPPEEIEEVSWKKTDEDENIMVLVIEGNEIIPDSAHERYRDRAEFFTDEIPKGNFSLRLKSVRTEDKGVYMCEVTAGDFTANATVVLEQLGFSSLHIMVLISCIAASGSAVLLCSLIYLIYCRSNADASRTVCRLQVSLVFCPNICMFFAFIFWGVTEGFLNETVSCCALYILRPVMLVWALPYLNYFKEKNKSLMQFIAGELAVLTVIVYSVLFSYAWKKSAHYTSNNPRIAFGIAFGLLIQLCLIIFIAGIRNKRQYMMLGLCGIHLTQLLQVFGSFGVSSLVTWIALLVLGLAMFFPVCAVYLLYMKARIIIKRLTIVLIFLGISLSIYVHIVALEKEEDLSGWACVIVFLEILWMMVFFKDERSSVQRRQSGAARAETSQQASYPLSVCNIIIYMFGAVVLILLNAVTLSAELILKRRNGERAVKDLRVIVFPSESVFAFYWLILQIRAFWNTSQTNLERNGRSSGQRRRCNLKTTAEVHQMENLSTPVNRQIQ